MEVTKENIKYYCDDILFQESDVLNFAEALEKILNLIRGSENPVKNLRYLRECFTGELLYEFSARHKYIIIPSHKSPAMYLAQKIFPSKNLKVGTLRATIKATISEFQDKFTEPKSELFNTSKIQECLDLAQTKFNTVNYIQKQKGLIYTLIFDHSHKDNDSVFETYKSGFSVIKLFSSKNEEDYPNPYFVFLHELGHSLHYAITGDFSIIPDFFKKFAEKFSSDTVKKSELFAHFFAIAVLNDTHLAKHSTFYDDSFKDIRQRASDLFKNFDKH